MLAENRPRMQRAAQHRRAALRPVCRHDVSRRVTFSDSPSRKKFCILKIEKSISLSEKLIASIDRRVAPRPAPRRNPHMTQPNEPSAALPAGLKLQSPLTPEQARVLTEEALAFIADLHRTFNPRRQELLAARDIRAASTPAAPDFLRASPHTPGRLAGRAARSRPERPAGGDHRAGGPQDGHQRPELRRQGFMADFEDASTPPGRTVAGQHNLPTRSARTISWSRAASLPAERATAVLMVRPRGWHLPEKHVSVDGETMSGTSSTSGCTSSTMPKNCYRAATAPTSTCRRWSHI